MNPSLKKAILLVVILASPALTSVTFARSIASTISMSEFKQRCRAAGGTVVDYSAGGVMCRLAGGGSVVCYSNDAGGINCDVLVEPPSRSAPKRFLDDLGGMKMSQ